MPKPFLKWAGGKTKLLDQLLPLLPSDIEERRYFEPFLGGGSMFFHLQPQGAMLGDVNAELITTYEAVRACVDDVLEELASLCQSPMSADTYYQCRERYNGGHMSMVEKAALFIYLNKTCFNGIYRVNKAGLFNVPYGQRKTPYVVEEEALRESSRVLRHAALLPLKYKDTALMASHKAFVYFDPPYMPLSATSNFATYAKEGFSFEDQKELRELCGTLNARGVKFMVSNSDTPELRELYSMFNLHTITATRSINSKGNGRGAVLELVVTNY